ncbi:J domain-containing protein [Cesiribacter sp. SM1]|uniref:J domain-containing protein n=1 Tax=Cesiribacter sp. SM1 TaxID=2861196 RepID=UPI001CD5A444|nr:J domain-containing protein [Cesiribacter sp. SM1]
MKDYYRILQINPEASQEEIKKAYRRLAKVHHPDVAANGRQEVFIIDLNEAYRTLSNPEKRSHYDWIRTYGNNYSSGSDKVQDTFVAYTSPQQAYKRKPFYKNYKNPLPERELVKPYLAYTYTVSKIALVFCILLLIDFLLPLRLQRDRAVYLTNIYSVQKGNPIHDHTQIETWSGKQVKVSKEAAMQFSSNPNMLVYKTRLFSKARYVTSVLKRETRYLIGRSIYGNFIFLPLLLLLTAFMGSLKRFPPELDFSLGLVSGVLMFICASLLLV